MSSGRSQESPRYFTRSYKRLKLAVPTSTSEPSKVGIREEISEPQLAPPESPVQRVLRLRELLSIIFGHLAADSDLDAIKNVRLVCSLWKQEAFFALKRNLSLIPYITVENPNRPRSHRIYFQDGCPKKPLQISSKTLMPGCGFPLRVVVDEWTPELEKFIRDFSREIISFWIYGIRSLPFYGFPVGLRGIELPALKHVKFSDPEIRRDRGELVQFVKAVTFWNNLVRASKRLETCEVNLEISYLNPVAPDTVALQPVEWSQVNHLRCSYEFFEEINAANDLSALQNLHLYYSKEDRENGANLVKQISFKKVPNLSTLILQDKRRDHVECILAHQMKELKFLKLDGTTLFGRQPPSRLLPNLEEVALFERERNVRLIAGLISGGGVFGKTVKLTLYENWKLTMYENWMDLNERIDDVADRICWSFPNLTELVWHSNRDYATVGLVVEEDVDEDTDGDTDEDTDEDIEEDLEENIWEHNNNALLSAPVIFSKLEFLTNLELLVDLPSQREVVELLTGISLENIPEDEDSWATCLVENTRSICNLKHLKVFYMSVTKSPVRVRPRLTRFLFNAAFRTMDTLEKLIFGNIIFADRSCATEWKGLGRQITF